MLKIIGLKLISFYQLFVSPFLGKRCRFYPTCSEYAYRAIEKHGLSRGLFMGIFRILRCNPYNKGGVDLP